jgi:hypothetical protein
MKLFTPGLFQSLLKQELELRDGILELLPLKYAFSQTCYCGAKQKKPLSQREHKCQSLDCPTKNISYDRDDFSALLMLTVLENKINLETYQDYHHDGTGYGYLPLKARTTIETRLEDYLNGKDHSLTTSGYLSRDNQSVKENSYTSKKTSLKEPLLH